MDLPHLSWPFFDVAHRQFAAEFDGWATANLGEFEQCEGGDGSDARQIFKLLAAMSSRRSPASDRRCAGLFCPQPAPAACCRASRMRQGPAARMAARDVDLFAFQGG
jgi:hypothetical protein